jgi:NAD(P)-dependent dehydrogenase (short-subunit alcohol dehydrogenase family)
VWVHVGPVVLRLTSSAAAWQSVPGGVLYSTSKLGLLGAVRALGQSFAKMGIRISTLCPFFAGRVPHVSFVFGAQIIMKDTPIIRPELRALLAGLPLASVERIAGAIIRAASDPDITTYSSVLMIPDDGNVLFFENERLKQGVYAEVDARLNKAYGFRI